MNLLLEQQVEILYGMIFVRIKGAVSWEISWFLAKIH